MVAKYGGARLHKIPRVVDIEHEVTGSDEVEKP
jgi:hypothetical protein